MAERHADGPRQLPRPGAPVRVGVWVAHLALPLLGIWLLLARPELDAEWAHRPTHFWLVLGVAAVNVALAGLVDREARRRVDARLFLVALGFLAGAGFLGVHALGTPGVLVTERTAGFVLATPVGLFVASLFAVASSARFAAERPAAVLHRRAVLRGGLLVLVVLLGGATLLGVPEVPATGTGPGHLGAHLGAHLGGGDALDSAATTVLAVAAVMCFGVAATRYWLLYRRRPAVMLLSVVTAFALLAEASATVALARTWHLSWWTWHLLMATGFGFVAYSSYVQYQREGRTAGLFDSVAAEQAVARIRAEHGLALETLVGAMTRREQGRVGDGTWGDPRGGPDDDPDEDLDVVTAGLAQRFGLTDGQTSVLGRAARALAADRDQIRRLGALVEVGRELRVRVSEEVLLQEAVRHLETGFGRDAVRVGLVRDGLLRHPPELSTRTGPQARPVPGAVEVSAVVPVASDHLLVEPLTVQGTVVGVLEAHRGVGTFAERDVAVFRSLASQLSVGLENARLYQQVDLLFRQYMSPDVAAALIADPTQAALGGAVVEVTVLFADLRAYTTFAERSTPQEVVAMLNRYFHEASVCILAEQGTIVQFVGDALMALFNAPVRQGDHALRAARAALALQRAVEPIAADRPGWPRFRVGVNTGPALVGNIGSEALRNYNATGDVVNVAARLQTTALPGTVVIGATTRAAIGAAADVEPLGDLQVKGRHQDVRAYVLHGLRPTPVPAGTAAAADPDRDPDGR